MDLFGVYFQSRIENIICIRNFDLENYYLTAVKKGENVHDILIKDVLARIVPQRYVLFFKNKKEHVSFFGNPAITTYFYYKSH